MKSVLALGSSRLLGLISDLFRPQLDLHLCSILIKKMLDLEYWGSRSVCLWRRPLAGGGAHVPLQGCDDYVCIFLLRLRAVKFVFLYIMENVIRQQVSDALAAAERPPHVSGRDLIGHPLRDHVDVPAVLPQHVWLVYELVRVAAATSDADQTVTAQDLSDVVLLPQVGNNEGLEDIGSAQHHHLRTRCAWRKKKQFRGEKKKKSKRD